MMKPWNGGKFDAANKACELLQREIERASKANQVTLQEPSKVIKADLSEPVDSTDVEKVINMLSRAKEAS